MSSQVPTAESESSFLVTVQSLHDEVRAASLDLLPIVEADSVVAVTYDESADSFLRTWRAKTSAVPEFVRIIDVCQTMRSVTTVPKRRECVRNVVRTVQYPDDLHTIQNAITSGLEEAEGKTVLLFDSLTSLFEHISLSQMVTFFDAVATQLEDADAVGYFYLETCTLDAPTVATLRVLADDTLELIDGVEWYVRSLEKRTCDCPPLDILFDSLRVRLRRDALRHLLRTSEPVDLDELATVVARAADGKTDRNQHRRYYTALYQLHLPKLADAGLIKHDETTQQVTLREAARWVEPFLALTDE